MKQLFIFLGGVALGSGATFLITKEYYSKLTDKEIQSVKDAYYSDKKEVEVEEDISDTSSETIETSDETIVLKKYTDILETNYTEVEDIVSDLAEKEIPSEEPAEKPYSITPEEYVVNNGYEKLQLLYYEDDETLVNEALPDELNPYIDMDLIGGEDSLCYFGDYEEDVMYIRNEHMSTDYEIILIHSTYAGPIDEFEGADDY